MHNYMSFHYAKLRPDWVWYFIQASELNSFGLKSGQKEERQRHSRTSNLIQEKEKGERK